MQIFNLQISKNDLTRREIRKYRVICSIDNLIRLIYILKENNLQNIKLNCETNPLQSLQKAISSEFDISRYSSFCKNKTLQWFFTYHIEFPAAAQAQLVCPMCAISKYFAPRSLATSSPGWWKPGLATLSHHQLLSPPAPVPLWSPPGSWSGNQTRCLAWERKYKTSATARVLELVGVSL